MHKFIFKIFIIFYFATVTTDNSQASHLVSDLKEKQYAIVGFDMDSQDFDNAMASFKAFLKLPDETKKSISVKLIPTHRRSDMGYVRRQKKNGDGDTKIFFHYHPILKEKYANLIKVTPEVAAFFNYADKIWHKAYEKVNTLSKDLEKTYPNAHKSMFGTKGPLHISLRFLVYDPPKDKKEKLARSHYDVGTCTLALAESGPGLRIGKDESSLKPVSHKSNQAIFFLSKNMEAMVGKDSGLAPAWHDVIRTGKAHDETSQRWAIVVFFDAKDATGGSQKDTHTVA